MVALGGGAVSYERGTPVSPPIWRARVLSRSKVARFLPLTQACQLHSSVVNPMEELGTVAIRGAQVRAQPPP